MAEKILVVDDNPLNIRLLQDILEDEGYCVETSDKSTMVPDMVRAGKHDVILLDVMMPEMDGFQVCHLLKEDPGLKDIPVIMVTARTEGDAVKRGLEEGAFDYIKKPIDEVEVVARVQSALRYKEQQDQLKEMAYRDGLTGLFNHGLLIDLFDKEYRKQEREQGMIAFVMLDIDFFKKVNDTCGHPVGDMVLQKMAGILTRSTRSNDIVGRYGGEEFAIVIPGTTREDLCSMCERIRQGVAEEIFVSAGDEIRITISIGACWKGPMDNMDIKNMIEKADEALYRAKESGRNRVECR